MIKKRIMAPGPTEVPPSVLAAASQPILHHRTPEYRAIFDEVCRNVKSVFRTSQPVLTFAAGGTGGMEAVIANLTLPGDTIIAISGGVFGERWAKIGEALGRKVVRIEVTHGEAVQPAAVHDALTEYPSARLVCGTLSETSTGVEHPVEAIAQLTSKTSALFAVDAVSGLGACVLEMDKWNVDVVVAGTQKGLMMPPGLALIALSDRGIESAHALKSPVFYWSFVDALAKLTEEKLPDTPYTPNVSLVIQLRESLRLIEAEGLDNVWRRHALLARATRAGITAMGLRLFAPTSPSAGVTSVHTPDGIQSTAIVKKMREDWGISIVGGQGKLKTSIFRIGHLGYVDRTDVLMTIAVLETVLIELGASIQRGEAVRAVQEVFLNA